MDAPPIPRLVDLVHVFKGVVVEQFKKRLEKLLSDSILLWRLLKLLFKILQLLNDACKIALVPWHLCLPLVCLLEAAFIRDMRVRLVCLLDGGSLSKACKVVRGLPMRAASLKHVKMLCNLANWSISNTKSFVFQICLTNGKVAILG